MGKRKSIAKSPESSVIKEETSSPSKSPNKIKNNPLQTPKQNLQTPVTQSERKKDIKKENNKRKSLPAKVTNGDGSASKKLKLEPFTGTSNLFTDAKIKETVSPKKNKAKLAKNDNKIEDASLTVKKSSNKKNEGASDNQVNTRKQKKQEKIKQIRMLAKEKYKKAIADVGSGNEEAINIIKNQIAKIVERPSLSKSGKRKLRTLRKVLREAGIEDLSIAKQQALQQQTKQPIKKIDSKKEQQKPKTAKPKVQKLESKTIPEQVSSQESDDSVEESDEDEDSDHEMLAEVEEDEEEESDSNDVEEENEEEEDEEEEDEDEESEANDVSEEEESENDEVSEEELDEASEEESGEESEEELDDNEESKPNKLAKKQTKTEDSPDSAIKKSRYVLFVGNLPYQVTKEDITEHFSKAGQAKDIRIPLDKQTNKPRGFAFVEMPDQTSYEKALSLHQTFIKGRKINVSYTQGGKKNSEEKKQNIKAKNFKLQAMRQQGKLAGNAKESQKRSFRRAKQRSPNKKD